MAPELVRRLLCFYSLFKYISKILLIFAYAFASNSAIVIAKFEVLHYPTNVFLKYFVVYHYFKFSIDRQYYGADCERENYGVYSLRENSSIPF